MELRHLRYFVAVADELHFTRAADRLQVAQSALSRQIRLLERELGVVLLARTKRSVQLTDAGRVFLERARRLLDDADRAQQDAQRAEHGDLGRLAIGLVPESTSELLSELLGAYHNQHPDVDIVLREVRGPEQVDALIAGRIQVGLLTQRVKHHRIRLTTLERLRLVVAMPATHRLAGRRSLRVAELAEERWVNNPTHTGQLHDACARAGFEPILYEHASDHTTRLALVAAGIGMTLMYESAPRPPSRHIVYLPLDQPKLTIDLLAARLEDQPSPLVDGFLDAART